MLFGLLIEVISILYEELFSETDVGCTNILSKLYGVACGIVTPLSWGSVLLYLQLLKGGCYFT